MPLYFFANSSTGVKYPPSIEVWKWHIIRRKDIFQRCVCVGVLLSDTDIKELFNLFSLVVLNYEYVTLQMRV